MIATTRDELRSRTWRAPAAWWEQEFPGVVGGRDEQSGGTWLAVDGARRRVAVVLNRIEPPPLPPEAAVSRGVLPLLAVDQGVEGIRIDARRFNPFNLIAVEPGAAAWLRYDGRRLTRHRISPGVHIVNSADLDDLGNPRQRRWLPEFEALAPARPGPRAGGFDWGGWPQLLADPGSAGEDPAALHIRRIESLPDYGTVSASLVALGTGGSRFEFCPAPPGEAGWGRVL